MPDSWTCLMVEKGPGLLADEVCTALKKAACHLYLRKQERMRIVDDITLGYIETDWQSCVVGGRTGMLFRSQIESETGDYKVNFLLNEKDLKRGSEMLQEMEEAESGGWLTSKGRLPVPELYDFFYDLSRARKVH